MELLKKEYTDAKGTALNYSDAWELLVATILSAQCTDEKVNEVTKELFKKYKRIEDYATADVEDLKQMIKPTGFFSRKAEYIKRSAEKLIKDFESTVPRSIEDLTSLLGVARKTANVVLSNVFGINEGIAVDTHVMRLSKRLGFTKHGNREKIELELMELFPRSQWFDVSNLLIAHGRNVCTARKPDCTECVTDRLCPSAFTLG